MPEKNIRDKDDSEETCMSRIQRTGVFQNLVRDIDKNQYPSMSRITKQLLPEKSVRDIDISKETRMSRIQRTGVFRILARYIDKKQNPSMSHTAKQ